jgi:hypothetical protein
MREIILWLSGYYYGEGHNTIVQPSALKRDEDKLNQYCYGHGDATVMDAVNAAHALALIPFPRRFPPPWSIGDILSVDLRDVRGCRLDEGVTATAMR